MREHDPVNHPAHYEAGEYECLEKNHQTAKKKKISVRGNLKKVFWANGYDLEDARELGFRSWNKDTWETAVEKLGVDYFIVQTSENVLEDLYGEYRLGENLRFLLGLSKMKGQEIADALGLSYSILSCYMIGKRKPSVSAIRALSGYFGYPAAVLLYGVLELQFLPQKKTQ